MSQKPMSATLGGLVAALIWLVLLIALLAWGIALTSGVILTIKFVVGQTSSVLGSVLSSAAWLVVGIVIGARAFGR